MANGATLFLCNGYTYCKKAKVAGGYCHRWICSNNAKCRAYLHIDETMRIVLVSKNEHCHPPRQLVKSRDVNIFMTARGKERLIYHNFTYYKQSRTRHGFRWGCTKNRWHKCKAYLHLADDMTIVRSNMEHTHCPIPIGANEMKHVVVRLGIEKGAFITLSTGATILMVNGYGFRKHVRVKGGRRYLCTTPTCKALVHASDAGVVFKIRDTHNHPHVKYKQRIDGTYERVRGFEGKLLIRYDIPEPESD